MSIVCKNCGNVFEGHYCNNCGQAADTLPVNAHFLVHDIQHGLLHYNGGLLYSARKLFTSPGHTVREYLSGKRIKYYKPISMVIVLASLYGLLYHLFHVNVFEGKESPDLNYDELNDWIAHHFSILTLVTIPLFALSSYVVFRSKGYNFMEHIVLNSFWSTQRLWVRILVLPLMLVVKDASMVTNIFHLLMIVDVILMLWTYSQFFNTISKVKVVLLTLLSYVLYYIPFTVLFVLAILIYERL